MAAVLGLTDLFHFADVLTRERLNSETASLRITHIQPNDDGRSFKRLHDTVPGAKGTPAFIIIPPVMAVPPIEGFSSDLISWLRERYHAGSKLASICGGAFMLAQTGLIETGSVTTHYSLVDQLSERFPKLEIDADKILIDNGKTITAGGFMAWTDLGLHLVERTLGPIAMLDTAKFLLIDPPRREQRFYRVFSPKLEHGDEAILKTQTWLADTPPRPVTTAEMAAHANLELRTFSRRFLKSTGLKPQEYCQHLRIAKARELLSVHRRPIQAIAWEVGYDDLSSFRSAFFKLTGLNPLDYRKRFGVG
jgi:transcriptional regulator GlxA family with amidase domain